MYGVMNIPLKHKLTFSLFSGLIFAILNSITSYFFLDNGFSWGEHGLIDKRHFYEESARIPLLIRCPDLLKGGGTINSMIQNVDIAPTILECAGIAKPDNMAGESFLGMLTGEEEKQRDKVYYEYYWDYEFPMTPTLFGVRTKRYKLIKSYGIWDRNELYDLVNDPHEMVNLINEPEYQELIDELFVNLSKWHKPEFNSQLAVKQSMPSGNPNIDSLLAKD